jgi:hypothetical protein
MKITVIKKAEGKIVRAACPWVIEDWSDNKKH